MGIHRASTVALLAALAAAVPPPPELSSCGGFTVDTTTQRFVDGCGRERFFRGINNVVKSPPYIANTNTFTAGYSLTRGDAALMQSLGFNGLRLGALWAGGAPTRAGLNASYIAALASVSTTFGDEYGVFTLVDAHQDTLSEAFCDDGAPIWLAHDMAAGAPLAFPLPIAATPCTFGADGRPTGSCCDVASWTELYASSAVSFAFQQLYNNATFYDQFATFWTALASAFAPLARNLIGYELLNEPWAGDVLADPLLLVPGVADLQNLQPFYMRLAAAIRSVSPAGIVFVEGVTWDDFSPLGFSALPGAAEGLAAISHHVRHSTRGQFAQRANV